jgi:2-dehydropantoate 2-reductase
MRIGIIGTGAMASIFGGGLIEAGHDVVFVGKNPATVTALNASGLTVDRDGAPSSHYAASAANVAAAASVGICDIVLVLVKSYDTAAAAQTVAHLVGPGTIVVTLQNGVGAGEILAAAFPASLDSGLIVQGVTYQGGTILGPGHVYHHSTAATVFGPFSVSDSTDSATANLGAADLTASETLATLWREAGWKVSVTPDIEAEVWKKVVVNGVNAVAATTRLPSRAMTESPEVRQLVEGIVLEGMAVAHALGYTQLDAQQAVADILGVLAETPDGRTSMLQDIDARRRTEIDVLNGAVIEAAERLGVEVPLNRALFAQVTAWEVEQGLRAS